MKQITIALQGVAWALLFNNDESYRAAIEAINGQDYDANRKINLSDDFGQQIVIRGMDIIGLLFEDLEQSKEAHVTRAIYNAHVQIQSQERAESDPFIGAAQRRAAMRQQAPIMSPFAGNGRMS